MIPSTSFQQHFEKNHQKKRKNSYINLVLQSLWINALSKWVPHFIIEFSAFLFFVCFVFCWNSLYTNNETLNSLTNSFFFFFIFVVFLTPFKPPIFFLPFLLSLWDTPHFPFIHFLIFPFSNKKKHKNITTTTNNKKSSLHLLLFAFLSQKKK